jgi:hypothetical protein
MWPVVKYKGKEERESCERRAEMVLLVGKEAKKENVEAVKRERMFGKGE